jgi:hypothetical protein
VSVRLPAVLGMSCVTGCLVLVGLLHALAGGRVDPVRLTISEYAFGDLGWVFDVAVLGLAGGSALVLVALLRAGLLRWPSRGALSLAVWVAALPVLVAFEKTDWTVGPSMGGDIHRYAGLAAFVALPVAALAVARCADPVLGRCAVVLRSLGRMSFCWLGLIVFGMVLYPVTGLSWWWIVPLGLAERGLALTEVAAVLLLGYAAWRCAGRDGVRHQRRTELPAPTAART